MSVILVKHFTIKVIPFVGTKQKLLDVGVTKTQRDGVESKYFSALSHESAALLMTNDVVISFE